MTPEQARARARLGAESVNHPNDQARIAEARKALQKANIDAEIARMVASWPPLSDDQKARLAPLLQPSGGAADG